MLWLRDPRQAQHAPLAAERDPIVPATLALRFDDALYARHRAALQAAAEPAGGIEPLLEALVAKQRLFARALADTELANFDLEALETLLETVFPARRKLYPALAAAGEGALRMRVRELLWGAGGLAARIETFVAAVALAPAEGRERRRANEKLRGAARDFAAELLHFRDPVRYPLMARWVWDAQSMTGALREFAAGGDSGAALDIPGTPEAFEAARAWLAERIEAEGIYRDVAFWVDLLLAAGYASYFSAITGGVLGSDFTRAATADEQIRKLLGIDAARRGGRSRVRRDQTGAR